MAYLYYIHDPMCSWCYAFDSVLKQIETRLPPTIKLIKIVGGLAADSMTPMPDSLAQMIQENWKKIEQSVPQVSFNFDFWKNNQAIRSTYPSCRAVLAAKKQSAHFEDKMIDQIQWAYYKNAENPSLENTLIKCAEAIGMNKTLFISDIKSNYINEQLFQQLNHANQLGITSYPSLCLKKESQHSILKINYTHADDILNQIHLITA